MRCTWLSPLMACEKLIHMKNIVLLKVVLACLYVQMHLWGFIMNYQGVCIYIVLYFVSFCYDIKKGDETVI